MRSSKWLSLRPRPRRLTACTAALALTVGVLLVTAMPAQAAAPANDDFGSAQVLLAALPTVSGTNVDATREVGEPAHAGYPTGQSVWYAWTAPSGGAALARVRISLRDSRYDTTLAVYRGSAPPFSGLTLVDFNDDFWGYHFRSRLTFVPTAGTTYYIAVDGASDGVTTDAGEFRMVFTQPGATGLVSGTISDDNGAGVENVCAYVVDANGDTDGPPGMSDASGFYSISGVPAGPANHIVFRNCGANNVAGEFYSSVDPPGPDIDGAQTLAGAGDVAVLAGQETQHVNARLVDGATLSGTLSGPGGSDLSNICVLATKVSGGDLGVVAHTLTDGSGGYSLSGLDGGAYQLLFGDTSSDDCLGANDGFVMEYYDDQGTANNAQLVTAVEGSETAGINAQLGGFPGAIHGDVRNVSTNVLLGNICVRATSSSFTSPSVNTTSNGMYTISGLPAATDYVVRFSDCHTTVNPYVTQYYNGKTTQVSADAVTVLPAQTTNGIDAALYRMATIAGTVTDPNGNPRENACVELYRSTDSFLASTPVSASGDWSFSVVPGSYKVHFFQCVGSSGLTFEPRWWDDQFLQQNATIITVAENQVLDTVDAVLTGTGNGRITGTVVGDDLDPLQDICVSALGSGPSVDATTDAAGHYTINGLTPSSTTYNVLFQPCDDTRNLLTQFWDDADPANPDLVTIVSGTTTSGIDAQMHTGGEITGTVTDPLGDPAVNVCVTAFDQNGSIVGEDPATDASGDYDIQQLPTGSYLIDFFDCAQEFIEEWYDDKPDFDSAIPIAVTQGQITTGINAQLARNGAIKGRVTNEDGDPVDGGGCGIYAFDPLGNQVGYGYFDNDGNYVVGGLETGSYVLQFSDCDGVYGDEYYDNQLSLGTADQIPVVFGNATSNIDFVVQDTAPVNTAVPVVTGNVVVGQTLSSTPGTWLHEPSTYGYQWLRCDANGASCSSISGAISDVHVLTTDDVGYRIRVDVTATNSKGDEIAESAATALVGDSPHNLTPPVVTGTTDIGSTLSGTTGSWSGSPTFARQWLRCDSAGANCTAISGATGSTYVTTGADAGLRLRFRVTATNPVGSTPASSDPTAVIGAPRNLTLPVVTGQTNIGSTLTTGDGAWTGSPTSYTYEWLRCDATGNSCSAIGGATSATYVTTGSDAGLRLRSRVTATNVTGSANAQSSPTALIGAISAMGVPAVTGQSNVGNTLTTGNGTWTGPPTSFTYEWLRCDSLGINCNAIGGATASTYVTTVDDAGLRLRSRVTATNAAGSTSAQSYPTALIGEVASLGVPSITGQTGVGSTLTTTDGTWTGPPTAFAYQWLRCDAAGNSCSAIGGATGSTYITTNSDAGLRLRSRVTASNSVGLANATSYPTALIGQLSLLSVPAITGQGGIGSTLTTGNGTWSGGPTSFTYEWLRCDSLGTSCNPIGGATASTYVTTVGDAGLRLRSRVTAANAGSSVAGQSYPSVVIGELTLQGVPAVSGQSVVGGTLTTSNGTWIGPPTSFAYQWLRCDASGNNCSAISGATASTYVPTVDDAAVRLRSKVTATNSVGSANGQSYPTAVIGGLLLNTSIPLVTGQSAIGGTLFVDQGSWSATPSGPDYQWLRCDATGNGCAPIGGATASTYVTTVDDAGVRLRARVTASNGAGNTAAQSHPTAVIGELSVVSVPAVGGLNGVGSTLTTSDGGWVGPPASFTYEWLRCDSLGAGCTPIGGETAATYVPTGADVGLRLRSRVTGTNVVGSASATSYPTPVIGDLAIQGVPTVKGQTGVGSTLRTSDGTWTGEPTSYTYEWLRCDSAGDSCTPIGGATAATYVPTVDDAGLRLRSRVTAVNSGDSVAAQSYPTAVIGMPVLRGRPVVTGLALVGATLTTSDGLWTGPPDFYVYQWLRCDPAGNNCATVDGAQGSMYVTTIDDEGLRLRVEVTAVNTVGSASGQSFATAVISP